MKPLIVTGCLVTGALAALFLQVPDLRVLGWLAAAHALVQSTGQLVIALGRRRLGAWIVLWRSLPIIPAGLLGAFGALLVQSKVRTMYLALAVLGLAALIVPLAARKLIRYADISSIDQANEKKVSILVSAEGRPSPKKIRLPLHLLSAADRDWLLGHLTAKLAAA